MKERPDGRESPALWYLCGNYFTTTLEHCVCLSVTSGADDLVKFSVYKLDRAVVLNPDSDAADSANHVPEMLSPRDAQSAAVVVRAMNSLDQPHACLLYTSRCV